MADEPNPLAYATPDPSVRPVPLDDKQVNTGSGLQIILAGVILACVVAGQLSAGTGRSKGLDVLVLLPFLMYAALSALAFAGSLRRNVTRRRALYGAYLIGVLLEIGVIDAVALSQTRPFGPADAVTALGCSVVGMLIVNPAAIWIIGRWLIHRVASPEPRPQARGFPMDVNLNGIPEVMGDERDELRSPPDVGFVKVDSPLSSDEITSTVRERG